MRLAVQYVRSVAFIVQMYLAMVVFALLYTPWAAFDRRGAFAGVHAYCRWVRASAALLVGLRSEIRGAVPAAEAIVAAKHQSFLDIIMIAGAVPRPKFVMKKELVWAPILGWYALRIGCVPVDRGRRSLAIRQMMEGVEKGRVLPGQLVIYPQGTRVAPGVRKPYKVGTAHLYEQLGQPCVPAATNVGVFWPRRSLLRLPGTAVVEFLPEIPPGRAPEEFLASLEAVVEEASDRLAAEARAGLRGGGR
jgi:1-acyl-sn-glycerol-3-phosphate acyltransferase